MNTLLSIIITPVLGLALLLSLIFASPAGAVDDRALYMIEPQAKILVNGHEEVVQKTTWDLKTPVEIKRAGAERLAPIFTKDLIEVKTGEPVWVYFRELYITPGAGDYTLTLLNWTPIHGDIVESGILGEEVAHPFQGRIQGKFSDTWGFRLNPTVDVPPGTYTLNFSALSTEGRGDWHDFTLQVKVLPNGLAK